MLFNDFSKFVQIWLMPPGINLLIALLGYLLIKRLQYLGKLLLFISVISLWLFSTSAFSQFLINGLQDQYPILNPDKLLENGEKSALIVLGGGDLTSAEYKSGHSLDLSTLARLHYAVYLNKKTNFPIIVSGAGQNNIQHTGADLMLEELQDYFKVPAKWKEDKSITTRDEAKFMVPILKKYGIKRAYIITNAWHIPRTMYVFNSSFSHTEIKIIAAPMGIETLQPNSGIIDYLPSLDGLITSKTAIHEYIGLLVYYLSDVKFLQHLKHVIWEYFFE